MSDLSKANLRMVINYFRHKIKGENRIWHLAFSILIGILCLITVALFFAVFVNSFKEPIEIFKNVWSLPKRLIIGNYVYLVTHHFITYYANSILVMVATILIELFLASLVAYGLGKFNFKGNGLILGYFLLGLMFPAQVAIVPLFRIVKLLHLYDSLFGIILLSSAGMSIPVFFLTKFLKNVPNSIMDAAKIDGAGNFRIYWGIIMPLIQPAIGALIPLTAVFLWNELFRPLVFISSDIKKTVPLGILTYYSGKDGAFQMQSLGIAFAAISASIFPMLVLYLIGSNKIIENITQGALKQ